MEEICPLGPSGHIYLVQPKNHHPKSILLWSLFLASFHNQQVFIHSVNTHSLTPHPTLTSPSYLQSSARACRRHVHCASGLRHCQTPPRVIRHPPRMTRTSRQALPRLVAALRSEVLSTRVLYRCTSADEVRRYSERLLKLRKMRMDGISKGVRDC